MFGEPMSIYLSSVDAYRDTTKWLAAFTPVTAVTAAVVLTGGPLAASAASEPNIGEWLEANAAVLIAGTLILAAVGGILAMAAHVLSVEPQEIVSILSDEAAPAVETIIGNGIAAPAFLTKASYEKALTTLSADSNMEPLPPDFGARAERLVSITETLREWNVFRETRARFRCFLVVVCISALAITAAVPVALAQLDTSAPISTPSAVDVAFTSQSAQSEAVDALGCTDVTTATFHALRGTWSSPVLIAEGSGCVTGASWSPDRGQAVVLPE
jgi:hypothetical protein